MLFRLTNVRRQLVFGAVLKQMLLSRCGGGACTECCHTSCTRC